ncbi:hypothetical protein Scep_030539 [Stephania cephalantha]|uniref:non-specific serine/threonine protein kinase n=1 Tax=Stephania cephalantha TaxID=152367 RepID=A0AAP0E7L4_9MAGN
MLRSSSLNCGATGKCHMRTVTDDGFLQNDRDESHSNTGVIAEGTDNGEDSLDPDEKLAILFSISLSADELRDIKNRPDEASSRGVLEVCIRSTKSQMDSSKASTSGSDAHHTRFASHWRGFFHLLKNTPVRRIPALPVKVPKFYRKHNKNQQVNPVTTLSQPDVAELCYLKSSWKNFTLSELKNATRNFSPENLIGKGGYAEVYKGCLENGQHVAVKRLTRGTSEDRSKDFLSELGMICHADHPNIAKLIGYGIDGGMHLVLEFSHHGSLDCLLHGSKKTLAWSIRYKVALGTAEGLLYLHESCQRRIIHRDIKPANILLSEEFVPKICDFGLAKWLPEQWTHHTVPNFEGTFGYLSPEYCMHGIIDEKTDVFAFGVVLLELITGRRALDDAQNSLVIWAKPLLEKNAIKELADPSITDAYDLQEFSRVALTALMCVQHSAILRPRMSQVVLLLKGDEASLARIRTFQKPLQRIYSEETLDANDYNSTRNVNDLLDRHRELAFEF